MDYVHYWKERAEIAAKQILRWMKVSEGTFYKWRQRYGKVNEHNGWIPRDHWLEEWEKRAILDFHWNHPLEGYRRLTYMMLDADVVAASASSVYRVLKRAGVLNRRNGKPSQKGKGFHQPSRAHQHWHVDIAYLNIAGTFYFLCSILDGSSLKSEKRHRYFPGLAAHIHDGCWCSLSSRDSSLQFFKGFGT